MRSQGQLRDAGLVLGAGGVTGEAFHRGVLRALHDVGVDPRQAPLIVGTSAGSLIGASLRRPADGPTAAADDEIPGLEDDPGATASDHARGSLVDIARMVAQDHLAHWAPPVGLLASIARHPERFRGGVLLSGWLPPVGRSTEFLSKPIGQRFAAGWPDGLRIVAVERSSGRRVVFGTPGAPETDVGAAVAASCAIPGYFKPVRIGRCYYVDGGAYSPTNADVVKRSGLPMVLVSSPMSVDLGGPRPRLDLGLRLVWHRYLMAETWRLRRAGMAVLSFEPGREVLEVMGANLLDGRRIEEVEELSYRAALDKLDHDRAEPAAGGTAAPAG